jgi:hypothetical protein
LNQTAPPHQHWQLGQQQQRTIRLQHTKQFQQQLMLEVTPQDVSAATSCATAAVADHVSHELHGWQLNALEEQQQVTVSKSNILHHPCWQ